jgi:hypothetical protein
MELLNAFFKTLRFGDTHFANLPALCSTRYAKEAWSMTMTAFSFHIDVLLSVKHLLTIAMMPDVFGGVRG